MQTLNNIYMNPMQTVNENKEVICTLVTIIVGAIIRKIEKNRMKRKQNQD